MKLKALVYQQKEWNPLQLSTDFPVFPVENITEEALAVWKLHAEEVLLITPTDAGIQAAVRAHMAVAAYADPAFPEQSYAGAWMVIEGFEEVDDEFLERIFQRCHGQPWGDCAHETVRDPGIVAGRSSRPGKTVSERRGNMASGCRRREDSGIY